jgi:hypothetical protein
MLTMNARTFFKPLPSLLSGVAAFTLAMPAAHAQASRVEPGMAVSAAPGAPPDDVLTVAGGELDRERVVKGAPYCADALHETVQILVDGNRIVQRQQTRMCRDGQGRTRQELSGHHGRRSVYLRDPVSQEAWLLDVDAQRAVRLLPPIAFAVEPGDAPPHKTGWWQRVVEWGSGVRQRVFGHGKPPADAPAASAAGNVGYGISEPPPQPVRVFLGGPGPMGDMPPAGMPPPAIAFHARLHGPRGPGVTTPLPPDTIEGLRADGQRTTWTLEPGRIGNERPIVIVHEVWSSPELGITLRSRDLDPLTGEENYRVQNLKRGEPDASLFRVPADYRRVQPGRPPVLDKE